ncbi:MAG: nitroreductase family protein [Treponema sp.]|jgi:nitroreductase|nr:nitroreductase family protein [Treponema sp.]
MNLLNIVLSQTRRQFMDVIEIINKRYSYRGAYKNIPVPREDLKKILEAGLAAPSGCNKQTTSLISLDEPKLLDLITNIIKKNGFGGANAPAGICVLTQKTPAYDDKYFYVQDYSAAIENMLIAITALGYASCWVEGQVTGNLETQKQIANILGIPDEYTVIAFLPVGIPEIEGKRPKYKAFSQRAWFNTFGVNA